MSSVTYNLAFTSALFYGPGGHTTQTMSVRDAEAIARALGVEFRTWDSRNERFPFA